MGLSPNSLVAAIQSSPTASNLRAKPALAVPGTLDPHCSKSSKISAWKMKPELQKDCKFQVLLLENVSELTQKWYSIQGGLGSCCTNCSVVFTAGLLNHPFFKSTIDRWEIPGVEVTTGTPQHQLEPKEEDRVEGRGAENALGWPKGTLAQESGSSTR